MKVELVGLTKHWGDIVAVHEVNLDVAEGEFVALLGPSGCGKTTTLLMLAGIYRPTEGSIRFDGRVVNRVAPRDRNIGMVFQSYALYPHMTVFENISYPLKLKRVPRGELRTQTQWVADLMDIGGLLQRKPADLSGGQQQRVALARALIKEPGLLLFDEPLSNLDTRLRLSMRTLIKRLQSEMDVTSIYVTHDQVEAMILADRIAVMNDGTLHGYDTPEELYERPRTMFVAGFIGHPPMNFLPVEVVRVEGETSARCAGLEIPISPLRGEKALGKGEVILGIRPEDVRLADAGIRAEVYALERLGRETLVDLLVGDQHVRALTDPKVRMEVDDIVTILFDPEKVHLFDPVSERSLLWN